MKRSVDNFNCLCQPKDLHLTHFDLHGSSTVSLLLYFKCDVPRCVIDASELNECQPWHHRHFIRR